MSLYVVSGLSGSGKSTILKWLSDNNMLEQNSIVIDQDSYFFSKMGKKERMDRITLSNGNNTINYDSPKSIDNKKLESDVKQYLSQGKNVYLSGFMFRKGMYDLTPKLHFHMMIGKELSLQRRGQSKNYSNESAKEKDKLMMEEAIFPEYLKTLRMSSIDFFFDGTLPIKQNGEKMTEIIRAVNEGKVIDDL